MRWLSQLRGFDYRTEAGNLWESSIPLACLKWEQRATNEAEVAIQRRDGSGKWINDSTHPLLDLLTNPNPFFDTHQLLDVLRFDYHLSGDAYLWKARAMTGEVVQLWWIPSSMIVPRWNEGGTSFIDCYEYSVNGNIYALPVEDVVHFRNGLDPDWQGRKGLSDFAAVLREVCTDNEAGVFTAALLRNMGVPGVIIAPKGSGDGNTPELTKRERNSLKELWQSCFTGERRGEPFVQSIPVEITNPGFSPSDLVLDKLRKLPEERITAAFGIPAVVLGLGAGLEASTAKASHADAREQAYESCVIPTLHTFSRALTRQLLSEFEDTKLVRIWFDLSDVRVLQEDHDARAKRASVLFNGGIVKLSEARDLMGFKSGSEEEKYKRELGGQSTPALPGNPAENPADVRQSGNEQTTEEKDETNEDSI